MPQLLLILLCLLGLPAHAAGIDGLLFVPSKQTAEVAVIDTRSDSVVRRLRDRQRATARWPSRRA